MTMPSCVIWSGRVFSDSFIANFSNVRVGNETRYGQDRNAPLRSRKARKACILNFLLHCVMLFPRGERIVWARSSALG